MGARTKGRGSGFPGVPGWMDRVTREDSRVKHGWGRCKMAQGGGTHSNHPASSSEWDLDPGRLQVPCQGRNAWPVESAGSALPSNEVLWPPRSAQDARGHTATPPARCQDILGKSPGLRPGREHTSRARERTACLLLGACALWSLSADQEAKRTKAACSSRQPRKRPLAGIHTPAVWAAAGSCPGNHDLAAQPGPI